MMDTDVLLRYTEKVNKHCSGIDPFKMGISKDPLPRNVHYFDIMNYCIGKHSSYTHETFNSHRTLDSFMLYESGWVQSIMSKIISNGSIAVARVKHSYKVNLKPLTCWVVVDRKGIVLTGHCDCMAGLGEVCSHIGAVLFLLEEWGRLSQKFEKPDEISCTEVLAQWLVPSTKKVEMASVDDIVWSTHPNTSTSLDASIQDTSVLSADSSMNINTFFSDTLEPFEDLVKSVNVEQPEEEESDEIDYFLHKIRGSGVFCTMMAMREPFSKFFVEKPPDKLLMELPFDEDERNISVIHLFLASRFNTAYADLSIEDLQEIATEIQLSYTQDEIDFIESKTRDQSSCKLWYRLRTGRVTGSTFKKVCRTSLESPATSTIERICYPEHFIFKSQQTTYGIQNESVARDIYVQVMLNAFPPHTNFSIKQTGLIINNNYPFCGASPDAMVSCDCCGTGTVEIKCPWLLKNGNLDTYLKKRDCPFVKVNGSYKLKVGHEYYYQVQMLIFLTDSEYCDFVVWKPPKETMDPTIVIRVYKDEPFWHEAYAKASAFFEKVLLPELLENYYSGKKKNFIAEQYLIIFN